jgi:hypothetical protein
MSYIPPDKPYAVWTVLEDAALENALHPEDLIDDQWWLLERRLCLEHAVETGRTTYGVFLYEDDDGHMNSCIPDDPSKCNATCYTIYATREPDDHS